MDKLNLDEQAVIACYEKYESVRPVAEQFDCSSQTIYRILVKYNIPRTHRHDKPKVRKEWNKKYCPAIIGMYFYVDGIRSATEIGRLLGIPTTSVYQILKRKYKENAEGHRKTRCHIDDALLDCIERDYIDGISTYEIGEKYGLYHSTVSKLMKKRGHYRGKGYVSDEKLAEYAAQRERTQEQRRKERAECKKQRDELLAYQRMQREAEREAERERRRIESEAEYAKEKTCASCGSVFHSECKTQLYCSGTCSRRAKRHRNVAAGKTKLKSYGNHRKRAREHGVAYEPGITTEKLIERDGNICQICGKPCDSGDVKYGSCGPDYPTIDHIVAIANGGSHTWDNVQLAHFLCNSKKRDLDMSEVRA